MSNIRRILMTSCFALALLPFAASAETALVYVTNSAGDDITVTLQDVNGTTRQTNATLTDGAA